MNVGLWIVGSSDVTSEGTVVVAPACRQAGSLLCKRIVAAFRRDVGVQKHPDVRRGAATKG